MCYCDEKGFWACDEEGTCGPGNLFYERQSCESGRADDDHSSDPSPTSWDSNDYGDDGQWFCRACGDNPGTVHYIIKREECCCTEDEDCQCESCEEPPTPEERLEQLCDAPWVWLIRIDDDSWANVRRLRSTDFLFPEELGTLYERRSISRLLVKGERASEIIQYTAHSAVDVCSLTEEELALYAPEPEKEDAQCRLSV